MKLMLEASLLGGFECHVTDYSFTGSMHILGTQLGEASLPSSNGAMRITWLKS
jgi:hypothetical protein